MSSTRRLAFSESRLLRSESAHLRSASASPGTSPVTGVMLPYGYLLCGRHLLHYEYDDSIYISDALRWIRDTVYSKLYHQEKLSLMGSGVWHLALAYIVLDFHDCFLRFYIPWWMDIWGWHTWIRWNGRFLGDEYSDARMVLFLWLCLQLLIPGHTKAYKWIPKRDRI